MRFFWCVFLFVVGFLFVCFLIGRREKGSVARLRGEVRTWEAANFPEEAAEPQPPPGWAASPHPSASAGSSRQPSVTCSAAAAVQSLAPELNTTLNDVTLSTRDT